MIIVAKFKNRKELGDFNKRFIITIYIDRINIHIVLIIVKGITAV